MKKFYIIFTVVVVSLAILMFNMKDENVRQKPAEMSGVHIMEDGTVMSPQGTPMADATILSNGTVKLGDGRVVQPAADNRK
jgi:hypothetical protein